MPNPEAVNLMFGRIARRYDAANRILSAGMDRGWRRRLVTVAAQENPASVLDLATGSGDVAFALRERLPGKTRILGVDFCQPMLDRAATKKRGSRWREDPTLDFQWADAQSLPYPDQSFDLATIAFGLRNLPDRCQALQEFRRVLRRGGVLLVLEFSQPSPWFRPVYFFYLRRLLPFIGGKITGDPEAYRYLDESIKAFPTRTALESELRGAGFTAVSSEAMAGGAVALHRGAA